MRLLNIASKKLETFASYHVAPKYVILSHTWGSPEEEITFEDINKISEFPISSVATALFLAKFPKKIGWAKLEGACRTALSTFRGSAGYIWIDTCCIDKSSSAELQEAINSMFSWYEHASGCLIYLSDVLAAQDPEEESSAFRRSRWFSRGWTLQELLASEGRVFFDRNWNMIGEMAATELKIDMESEEGEESRDLTSLVSKVTGIEEHFFGLYDINSTASERLSRASIAARMSWAARRETTRPEDIAYCLLGIFDIHMPMLYGEGSQRAFFRLQEEIMKVTDDCTLFSWGLADECHGMDDDFFSKTASPPLSNDGHALASHPGQFVYCGQVETALGRFPWPSFSMGQRGLAMRLPVKRDPPFPRLAYGVLACADTGTGNNLLAIPLVPTELRSEYRQTKREFIRESWCRPFRVTEQFLGDVEEEDIIIRRPSMALREMRLGFFATMAIFDGFRVVQSYPYLSMTNSRNGRFPDLQPPPYFETEHSGQDYEERVVHVTTGTENFLVSLECAVRTSSGPFSSTPKRWIYFMRGRVYKKSSDSLGPFRFHDLWCLRFAGDVGKIEELEARETTRYPEMRQWDFYLDGLKKMSLDFLDDASETCGIKISTPRD